MTTPRPATARLAGVLAIALALGAANVRAQGAPPSRDYVVQPPIFRLSIDGGYDQALASGGFWNFTTDQLTLSRGSFGAPRFGGELGFPLTRRVELVVGASHARRSAGSEYRDLVGTDDLPIAQSTRLVRTPVSIGLRWNLAPAGRTLGSLAWVPTRTVPWIGAGGGAMRWSLRQSGEFVDAPTNDIFRNTFVANGWAPLTYAAAGLDRHLSPRTALSLSARYTFARDALGEDFRGFPRLNLSGVSLQAGLTWRL